MRRWSLLLVLLNACGEPLPPAPARGPAPPPVEPPAPPPRAPFTFPARSELSSAQVDRWTRAEGLTWRDLSPEEAAAVLDLLELNSPEPAQPRPGPGTIACSMPPPNYTRPLRLHYGSGRELKLAVSLGRGNVNYCRFAVEGSDFRGIVPLDPSKVARLRAILRPEAHEPGPPAKGF